MNETVFGIAWLGRSATTGAVELIEESQSMPGQTLAEIRALAEERVRAGGVITGYQISQPDGTVVGERLPPEN